MVIAVVPAPKCWKLDPVPHRFLQPNAPAVAVRPLLLYSISPTFFINRTQHKIDSRNCRERQRDQQQVEARDREEWRVLPLRSISTAAPCSLCGCLESKADVD
ncbi:hypothetical protein Cni_G12898 [Canna indica]|uniref:Uncharacterized protein n=1 Tax=Canna indica TaxID=4628 RepID=A0AAQ3K8M5_9LILI|nr:hypothetical protein Cni_G12898 [Canna indica]